ncbi:DUF5979 domain-containing protein [Leifsonia xyli]|uniref:DUF5979 domain-containing protein n=1 Tax=Leifsonia xyli TaxID=1575 RepID=UPI00159F007B|nr:DUF5979 domain-containing protein [Leifsonia xyli]
MTTAPGFCQTSLGTTAWPIDPTCAQHPLGWTPAAAFAGDWSAVTGLQVTLDFRGTAAGTLRSGESAAVRFHTVDRPADAGHPDGAPVTLTAARPIAWNQFGASVSLSGGGSIRRAPIRAGVALATGPLRVDKALTGAAAAEAPDEFAAEVVCTVAGTPVELGGAARLALARATGFTARLDGIPVGADCTVAEAGAPGSYGEAARSVSAAEIRIAGGAVGGAVPPAQSVTVTNTYEYGRLALAKTASTSVAGMNEDVTYTITVGNVGVLDATDFEVADTLPPEWSSSRQTATVCSGTASSPGRWRISPRATGSICGWCSVIRRRAPP